MSEALTTKTESPTNTLAKAEKSAKKSGFGKTVKIVSLIFWLLVVLLVLIPLLGRLVMSITRSQAGAGERPV